MKVGIARASKTLKNIQGAWINEQTVEVKDGEVTNLPGEHEGHVRARRLRRLLRAAGA